MPEGFEVGAAPRHGRPVDSGARAAAAKHAGAERARDEKKVRALVGETLPPEEAPAPPPVDPTVAVQGTLMNAFGVLFAILERAVDPKWAVTPTELQALSGAWAPIALMYLPAVETVGPWGLALMTTGAVVGPRLMTPDQPKPEENAEPVPAAA